MGTDLADSVFAVVQCVPRGRCVSYGIVGRVSVPRLIPLAVGRIMRQAPEGVPWWRVVGADGRLPLTKLDPEGARLQRERLEAEGVVFKEDCILRSYLLQEDELADCVDRVHAVD